MEQFNGISHRTNEEKGRACARDAQSETRETATTTKNKRNHFQFTEFTMQPKQLTTEMQTQLLLSNERRNVLSAGERRFLFVGLFSLDLCVCGVRVCALAQKRETYNGINLEKRTRRNKWNVSAKDRELS